MVILEGLKTSNGTIRRREFRVWEMPCEFKEYFTRGNKQTFQQSTYIALKDFDSHHPILIKSSLLYSGALSQCWIP